MLDKKTLSEWQNLESKAKHCRKLRRIHRTSVREMLRKEYLEIPPEDPELSIEADPKEFATGLEPCVTEQLEYNQLLKQSIDSASEELAEEILKEIAVGRYYPFPSDKTLMTLTKCVKIDKQNSHEQAGHVALDLVKRQTRFLELFLVQLQLAIEDIQRHRLNSEIDELSFY